MRSSKKILKFSILLFIILFLISSEVVASGSSLEPRYSLKDVIPNNMKIRNQGDSNACWTFAMLSSLETNLALKNKQKVYDFSEKHMNYATSRMFKDGKINDNGFNRSVQDEGTFEIAIAYLTNGSGAVAEIEMPFTDDNELISISELKNKKVITEVLDTTEFPSYEAENVTNEFKNQMKEHIKNYGSISANIHGAEIFSDYYNNETGALYCDNKQNCPIDHGVSIIGWDDNYSTDNFNTDHKPTNNGAWIIRNSWGEEYQTDLEKLREEIKQIFFAAYPQECQNNNWNESTDIPNDIADQIITEDYGYTISGNKAYSKIGDNGIMYVSYEDVNIYSKLAGIEKASDKVTYDNIYQYNELGQNSDIEISSSKVYLGNIFTKKSATKEFLTKVSLYAPETYKCKVYVNTKGASMNKEDLEQVRLKNGESETIKPGYHTLEFLNPIEITANEFAVVVEIEGTRQNAISISTERKIEESFYSTAKIEDGKCFVSYAESFEQNDWTDLSKFSEKNPNIPNSDSTIKAFTIIKDKQETEKTKNTEKTEEPNKTSNNAKGNPEKQRTVSNGEASSNSKIDNTVAKGIIPQTGTKITMFLIAFTIIITGIFGYVKYKKINKYIK